MDATPEALRAMCRTHAAHGTTGLLATTMTQSREAINAALTNARTAVAAGPSFCEDGAQVLGVHLEGPYISPQKPGAQPKEFVRDYDADEFASWLKIAGGTMKLITLAPERPGAADLIAACRAAGIVVSIGHTDADAAQTKQAIDRGAGHATHLFNAMPPIHHRNPGPIPVMLTDARMRVEIIADGQHVAPEVVRMTLSACDERLILITDAIRGAGMGDGVYDLGGQLATVTHGRATLADGTLAGSVLTMDRAAANLLQWTGADWMTVVAATSTTVATEMGWPNKGTIISGADADMVLVDDDLNVHATFVAGRCVYQRG
jgi:N-acetylglucosamine-6-phosphate deacetylase